MIQKLFFAGSGGQGVILMGQMTAYAAMYENKEVTFPPMALKCGAAPPTARW